jgi:hypothetical protein
MSHLANAARNNLPNIEQSLKNSYDNANTSYYNKRRGSAEDSDTINKSYWNVMKQCYTLIGW